MKNRETESVLLWNLRLKKLKAANLNPGEDEELEKLYRKLDNREEDS